MEQKHETAADESVKLQQNGAEQGQARKTKGGKEQVERLGKESVPKLIVEFAIPAIVGTLVNAAYNLIASIFLGQAMGEIGLATATVANPIMILFLALSMLVGAGGNALAALRLGQGRHDDAEKCLGNVAFLAIVLWIIVAAIAASPAIEFILDISSSTESVRPYARNFIRILCFGFVLQIFGFGVNNFIRTAGRPNRALFTMVIGAVVCTICSYLFVVVFDWGVEGSAAATLVGQGVSAACVLWFFTKTKGAAFKLHLKYMKPNPRLIRDILILGIASFAVQIGAAILNFALNYLLVRYGMIHPIGAEGAQASIGVVQRIALFTIMPLVGMSIALQPLLGFNYGARLIDRVRKILFDGVLIVTAIGIIMWAAVHIWPVQIVSLFGITNPYLQEFTIYALKVQLLMLPIIGFQIVGAGYFQATGQPLKSIILTLTRQVLFLLPLLFIMPSVLPTYFPSLTGLDALIIATPISDCMAVVMVFFFLLYELRRLKKVESGEIEVKILEAPEKR